MSTIDDVLIVGAGPAGTSAALGLAHSGLRVRLVDAGVSGIDLPPAEPYLALRTRSPAQWRWQLGETFTALAAAGGASPKLRVPGLRRVFEGFAAANRIVGEDGFHIVGALAAGGLSNAWGCGVAAFDADELAPLPARAQTGMAAAYARVARRIGLSGASDDALAQAFGVDAWSAPPLPLDPLFEALWARAAATPGFALGRARVAVLSDAPRPGRDPCDLLGLCLWGCPRRATWSAAMDLEAVRAAGIAVDAGVVVSAIVRDGDGWRVDARVGGEARTLRARRVLLGAGTLATTRLVLAALPAPPAQVALQSNPMAAFLALLPAQLGRVPTRGFGLAQLSFRAQLAGAAPAYGNLFSTGGLPVSEFLDYLPIGRRAGLPLLRALLPACVVGNVFLPGALSAHLARLDRDGQLRVAAGAAADLPAALADARSAITTGLRRAGAWLLPGSFVPGPAGADLHYAATLPMRATPAAHECSTDGEVAGLPGIHVVDGASLPALPAKAHTLTIMANADRIARVVGARLGAPPDLRADAVRVR